MGAAVQGVRTAGSHVVQAKELKAKSLKLKAKAERKTHEARKNENSSAPRSIVNC